MLKLREESLDWALKHIESFGDTDIFPLPFEFKAIKYCWDEDIVPWLKSEDVLQWKTRTFRRCLTPKHRYGFRISTQLDPIDVILYTALVAEIGEDIEKARLPRQENIAFSYRFQPSDEGRMWDPKYSWGKFQEHCLNLVNAKRYSHVLLADIADFYPRVYLHPLENALRDCTNKKEHAAAITSMIKNWNFRVSYGIPVGTSASRLIAELILDDVDRGLLSEGTTHCRHVDDFCIFCSNEREAHERLALLARILFENQGLTLQQHKTRIMTIDEFSENHLNQEERHELNNLAERFRNILKDIGLSDPYQELDYEDLKPEKQNLIDSLNLMEILEEQTSNHSDLNISLVRFVLRRLKQIDSEDCIDLVLDQIDALYPVFRDVIEYLQALRSLKQSRKQEIGSKLLDLLSQSLVGHLEYHRLWIFDTFTRDREWDNEGRFTSLYNSNHDDFSRRKLILAMGRTRQQTWFKTHKRDINETTPWVKRAFLAAASCMPGDEPKHWYRSIRSNLDPLERAIVKWATDHPF